MGWDGMGFGRMRGGSGVFRRCLGDFAKVCIFASEERGSDRSVFYRLYVISETHCEGFDLPELPTMDSAVFYRWHWRPHHAATFTSSAAATTYLENTDQMQRSSRKRTARRARTNLNQR